MQRINFTATHCCVLLINVYKCKYRCTFYICRSRNVTNVAFIDRYTDDERNERNKRTIAMNVIGQRKVYYSFRLYLRIMNNT